MIVIVIIIIIIITMVIIVSCVCVCVCVRARAGNLDCSGNLVWFIAFIRYRHCITSQAERGAACRAEGAVAARRSARRFCRDEASGFRPSALQLLMYGPKKL